jgi:hypothetical protein
MISRWKALVGAAVALAAVLAIATQLTAMSYASLRDELRAHGASVREDGPGSQPFLGGADHRLTVDGAGVDVFEYRATAGAGLDAARISPDGATINKGLGPFGGGAAAVDFVAPPHWFHSGRVIVLYVGRDNSVLTLLRATLGAQFAGG